MDGVEVGVGQPKAGAVDWVEKVKDGVMDLGGEVHELEAAARAVVVGERFLICDGIGTARGPEGRSAGCSDRTGRLLL